MKDQNRFVLAVEKDIALTLKGRMLALRPRSSLVEMRHDSSFSQERNLVYRLEMLKLLNFVFRKLEQPPKVHGYMENKTVQFFLRDIERLEMSVDEEVVLEKFFERPKEDEDIVLSLRKMRYEKPRFIEEFNITTVSKLKQTLKRVLFQERWASRFGHEIKEKVRGPLYRYEPKQE